jgi:hypothetical protein
MTDFWGNPFVTPISHERIMAQMSDGTARRIHFPTSHRNALKRSDDYRWVGRFSVPFFESIGPVFENQTGLDLSKGQYGYWVSIRSERDYETIEQWVDEQGTTVFIRDCLDLSIALDLNWATEGKDARTPTGELEYRAKYKRDPGSLQQIVELCSDKIRNLPMYSDARAIAAVPPRDGKDFDLPSEIVSQLACDLGLQDVTGCLVWQGKKQSLKEVKVGDKWEALERTGLNFEGAQLDGAPVILIDDLYQSGITMQFVASKLREAGAGEVYGLAIVKSWRDTDNQ